MRLQGEQIYEFTANGMSASGPLHTTAVQWNGVHKVVETGNFFFIFLSSQQAYFVPREAVARQLGLEPFRAMLTSHLPEKTKLRQDSVQAPA